MERCEVILGNVGIVWTGVDKAEAWKQFMQFSSMRLNPGSRAYKESLTLLIGDEIKREILGDDDGD